MGFDGSAAIESQEKKNSILSHPCDSALFTLSWRVAQFNHAGEALGWVAVLTKSQFVDRVISQDSFMSHYLMVLLVRTEPELLASKKRT